MSDTALLLVLVALNLVFASALAGIRLTALGWASRQVWALVAEMWAAFLLFIGIFGYVLKRAAEAPPRGVGPASELSGFAARFMGLPPEAKAIFVGGLVLTIGLFFHMLITLNRHMNRVPPES